MHVYTHTCVFQCEYLCVHACFSQRVWVYVYTCAYVFLCVYVHACFSVCVLVYVCMCADVRVSVNLKKPNSHKPKYSKAVFLLQEEQL